MALLFIIFDVEVAFFFPWANVFGKSTHLMDPNLPVVKSAAESDGKVVSLTPAAAGVYRELNVPADAIPASWLAWSLSNVIVTLIIGSVLLKFLGPVVERFGLTVRNFLS